MRGCWYQTSRILYAILRQNATILVNLSDKVSFASNISLKDCKKNCNVLKWWMENNNRGKLQ